MHGDAFDVLLVGEIVAAHGEDMHLEALPGKKTTGAPHAIV
jgi:hypothetical protein